MTKDNIILLIYFYCILEFNPMFIRLQHHLVMMMNAFVLMNSNSRLFKPISLLRQGMGDLVCVRIFFLSNLRTYNGMRFYSSRHYTRWDTQFFFQCRILFLQVFPCKIYFLPRNMFEITHTPPHPPSPSKPSKLWNFSNGRPRSTFGNTSKAFTFSPQK